MGFALSFCTSDLISPVVAAMLFWGRFHNFSLAPLTALDWSRRLEDVWGNALFKQIPSNKNNASEITQHNIPYKTAAFLCARFPFVTSGGRAEGQLPNRKRDCKPDFHLIDGGYVENMEPWRPFQIIRRLQQITRKNPGTYKVWFDLLFLCNGQTSDQAVTKPTFRFLSKPLMGFLNAADCQGISLDQLVVLHHQTKQ